MEQKLWKITSFEEYKNEWKSVVGEWEKLTTYQKSFGFKTVEEFFTSQLIAIQNLANDRVGGIIDNRFNSEAFNKFTKQNLKKFSYQAIDNIRTNDLIVAEMLKNIQTATNNNRSDTLNSTINSIEKIAGTFAWRSFKLSGIERLYLSYKKNGIDECTLIDFNNYYTKEEVNFLVSTLQTEIDTKANKSDIPDVSNLETKKAHETDINTLQTKIDTKASKIDLKEGLDTKADTIYVNAELVKKQDKLIPGNNIIIENNVISAVSTISWIPGEYKWMPTTVTSMPTGWKKVDIINGYTLVKGSQSGTTTGKILSHQHYATANSSYLVPAMASSGIKNVTATLSSGTDNIAVGTNIWNGTTNSGDVRSGNSSNANLAAGLNADLWQYDPNNEF